MTRTRTMLVVNGTKVAEFVDNFIRDRGLETLRELTRMLKEAKTSRAEIAYRFGITTMALSRWERVLGQRITVFLLHPEVEAAVAAVAKAYDDGPNARS